MPNIKLSPCEALTTSAYGRSLAAIFPQFKIVRPVEANPCIVRSRSHSKHPRDERPKACAPVYPVRLYKGFEVRVEATDAGC